MNKRNILLVDYLTLCGLSIENAREDDYGLPHLTLITGQLIENIYFDFESLSWCFTRNKIRRKVKNIIKDLCAHSDRPECMFSFYMIHNQIVLNIVKKQKKTPSSVQDLRR